MKVILIADVKKVGQKGTLITVADGYAQNVLIPRKLAVPATPENLKRFEQQKQAVQSRLALDNAFAKRALADIAGKTITIHAKANEKGTLFDSINAKHLAEAIAKDLKVAVSEDAIALSSPIKKLGEYRVKVSIQGSFAEVLIVIGT